MRVRLLRARTGRAGAWTAIAGLSALLAGCGGGVLSKSAAPTYDLVAPAMTRTPGALRGQLVIAEPTTIAVLDTEKVVVRSSGAEVSHLPDVQWSDRLPKLVQVRLIQSFENANKLRVGRPDDRLTADYMLVSSVRAFDIATGGGQAYAEVEIAAKIVADRAGRIVAARVFRAAVPVGSVQGPAAIEAINEAFQKAAADLVKWAGRVI